jgi:linoleoyl-CoA desaturase
MTLSTGDRPKFRGDDGFHQELRRRVEDYFRDRGLSAHDSARMYFKTAAMLLWCGASYALLVFAASSWWQGLLLSGSLALAMAGIGFSVQHDANHHAYSNRPIVNRVLGTTLDLLGASSYLWHWKHNVLHHTYPNLDGADDDIDFRPFARLSPAQPRYWIHGYQHLYLWVLYGFLGPKWHLVDDFKSVVRGRIGGSRFPRPRGWNLFQVIAGKAAFFGWAVGIPLLFHTWWVVLLFYAVTAFMLGLALAVVFQLAHCVEEASFPSTAPATAPARARGSVEVGWAAHQVQTTVDFAQRNRLLTWYLGGLNFQIEHHLFPRICHVHYPRIARIVKAACADFGVRYAAHEGVGRALQSHWRWLRRMGRPLLAT